MGAGLVGMLASRRRSGEKVGYSEYSEHFDYSEISEIVLCAGAVVRQHFFRSCR